MTTLETPIMRARFLFNEYIKDTNGRGYVVRRGRAIEHIRDNKHNKYKKELEQLVDSFAVDYIREDSIILIWKKE